MRCRHCNHELNHLFIDLGSSPPSNSYLTPETINKPERWYPLKVFVCDHCWLVQTEDVVDVKEIFPEDYAYFSSFSTSWLNHARCYVESMADRFTLGKSSNLIEIGANDGYLLQFAKEKGIPCYGIEPTHSTAKSAREKGVEIIESFFGSGLATKLAKQGRQTDLIVANNVLAHVPDINGFVSGISILLKPGGVATVEFPHLLNMIEKTQFDTIYHEHYSYLSLMAIHSIFEKNGLCVFDVEELETHGGSIRVFAQRRDGGKRQVEPSVIALLEREKLCGVNSLAYYDGFQSKAEQIKADLLTFLLKARAQKKKVVGYGAAAKGNTIMNYAGIRSDLIRFIVDRNPAKQNKYMPGSRVPIVDEGKMREERPDYVLILPWNLGNEIMAQLSYIRKWGGQFVTAVPKLVIM